TPLGQPLTGHTNSVFSVAFSPDGHTLASGNRDLSVRLWNVTDPAHPTTLGQPLTGHTNEVLSVAFSPDGHTLASGSFDHTVWLWEMNADQAIQRICASTTNTLTPAKWEQYVSKDLPCHDQPNSSSCSGRSGTFFSTASHLARRSDGRFHGSSSPSRTQCCDHVTIQSG
ncbi:MAG: hypothetical protein WAK86_17725, partial [Pseudonocardiaceae bacterium]